MVMTEELRFADDVELLDFPLRAGLSYRERKEAEFLKTINRGVMLVTGEAGSGKDLFATFLAALNKYYFADLFDYTKPRKILLDFMPKRAFGTYVPFDGQVMMNEINKMAKAAKMENFTESNDTKEGADFVDEATHKWALEGEGEMLLKGGYLYLSELKRYCYCRNPHNPFNKFIGSICDVHRHLDLLIVGTHIMKEEIDKSTFLAKTSHWAKCEWMVSKANSTLVKITRGKFYDGSNVWNLQAKPQPMIIDGAKPRAFLNGHRAFDLYPTKNYVNLKPVIRKED